MIRVLADCTLSGEHFNPRKLQKILGSFKPEYLHAKGEIDTKFGDLWGHGAAILSHPSHIGKTGKKIAWDDMLAFLLEHQQTLRKYGVEEIDLSLIFFYQDSGGAGWHIEAEDIQKLAKLGIGL